MKTFIAWLWNSWRETAQSLHEYYYDPGTTIELILGLCAVLQAVKPYSGFGSSFQEE